MSTAAAAAANATLTASRGEGERSRSSSSSSEQPLPLSQFAFPTSGSSGGPSPSPSPAGGSNGEEALAGVGPSPPLPPKGQTAATVEDAESSSFSFRTVGNRVGTAPTTAPPSVDAEIPSDAAAAAAKEDRPHTDRKRTDLGDQLPSAAVATTKPIVNGGASAEGAAVNQSEATAILPPKKKSAFTVEAAATAAGAAIGGAVSAFVAGAAPHLRRAAPHAPSITLTHGFIAAWSLWTALLTLLGWLEASLLVIMWTSFAALLVAVWLSQLPPEGRRRYTARLSLWYAEAERQAMLSRVIAALFVVRAAWAMGLLVSLEVLAFGAAIVYIVSANRKSVDEKRLLALNILASSGIRGGGGGGGGPNSISSSNNGGLLGGGGGSFGSSSPSSPAGGGGFPFAFESAAPTALDAELLRRVLGSDLPPWVNFPNVARGEFFNVLLAGMWPYLSEALDGSTRTFLDNILEVYRPAAFTRLVMTVVKFGTVPIVVTGVEAAHVGSNSYLDLHVVWAGDSDLQLAAHLSLPATEFTVQLRHVKLRGVLRIEFGGHIKRWPCFSMYSFSFIKPPELSFDLSFAGLNASMIPFAKDYFDDLFKHFINIWLVHPNRLRFSAVGNAADEAGTRADAHGLLCLRLRSVEGHKERMKVAMGFIGDTAVLHSNSVTPRQEGGGMGGADASNGALATHSSGLGAADGVGGPTLASGKGGGGATNTVRSADANTKGYVADIDDFFQLIIYDKGAMLKFSLLDAGTEMRWGSSSAAPIATATEYVRYFSDREGTNVGRAIPMNRRSGAAYSGSSGSGVSGGSPFDPSSTPPPSGGGSAAVPPPSGAEVSRGKPKTDLVLRYDAHYYPFLTPDEGRRYWHAMQSARRENAARRGGPSASSLSSRASVGGGGGNFGGDSFAFGAGGQSPTAGGGAFGRSPDLQPTASPTLPLGADGATALGPPLGSTPGRRTNSISGTTLGGASPAPPPAAVVAGETVYFSHASAAVSIGSMGVGSPLSGAGVGMGLPPPSGGGGGGIGGSANSRLSGASAAGGANAHKTRNLRKPPPLAVLFVNINRCQDLLETVEGIIKKSRRAPDTFVRTSFLSQAPGCDGRSDTQVVKGNRHPSFWAPCHFTVYSWEDRVSIEVFDASEDSSSGQPAAGRVPPIGLAEIAEHGLFMKVTRPLVEGREVDAGSITFELTLRIIGTPHS